MKTTDNLPIANVEDQIEVFRKLVSWFNDRGFNFCLAADNKTPLIAASAGGDHCNFCITAYIDHAHSCVNFLAILGILIPESSRDKVQEFILRLNHGVCTPCLVLSSESKTVCAVSRIPLTTAEITDDEINEAVNSVCELIDASTPPLMKIVFSNVEPTEALKFMNTSHPRKGHGRESPETSIPRS